MNEKIILGIETSCDETACALYAESRGLLFENIYSQWRRHAAYGGVVPELAARDHLQRLLPMIAEAVQAYGRPTHIAYTNGPGLASALLTGATTAKALAFAWNLPTIAVNHLEGHLLSPLLSAPTMSPPYLALLVSGGHTQLWQVKDWGDYILLGQTLDDAVGEAFDKVAVLLGLGYPGGERLEKLAKLGNAKQVPLSIDISQPPFNWSLSGLKTAVRKLVGRYPPEDIAAAFQEVVAKGLIKQVQAALIHTGVRGLVGVGGVARNQLLRARLAKIADEKGIYFACPEARHCSDNAAMIAFAATHHVAERSGSFDINPRQQPSS